LPPLFHYFIAMSRRHFHLAAHAFAEPLLMPPRFHFAASSARFCCLSFSIFFFDLRAMIFHAADS
jgi:hypothetical protein